MSYWPFLILPLCDPSRPPRPAEREAHREASGDGPPFFGAAAEAEPPGVLATVCEAASENDRPASDRHRPRPPHPAAEEDGGGHVLAPAAAGDHEGLVLTGQVEEKKGKKNREGRGRESQKDLILETIIEEIGRETEEKRNVCCGRLK